MTGSQPTSVLSDLLHERLAAEEPPLWITPTEIVRRGRRARRLRATVLACAAVVSGCGLAAAAILGGGLVDVAGDDEVGYARAPVVGVRAEAALQDAADRAFTPYVGELPPPTVGAFDEAGLGLDLEPGGVFGVRTEFALADGGQVSVGVTAALSPGRAGCERWTWTDSSACRTRQLADGTTVRTAVIAFGSPRGQMPGAPTLLDGDWIDRADRSTLTWSRGVLVESPDGHITGAFELVAAPTYTAALDRFRVPTAALVDAATDPDLGGG